MSMPRLHPCINLKIGPGWCRAGRAGAAWSPDGVPLSWNEIRHRAIAFAREWKGEAREAAERRTLWNEFFNVFGVRRRTVASFEAPVRMLSGYAKPRPRRCIQGSRPSKPMVMPPTVTAPRRNHRLTGRRRQ